MTLTMSLFANERNISGLWDRPVVIGASLSDGFSHQEPLGGLKSEKLSLEHYLNKLIKAPHGKIENLGNKFYFMRPAGVSVKQVENASELNPSVLFAPDYLFWLVYGNYASEQTRMSALKKGLSLLEKFHCPMVVGNIPDASKAVYKMLAPSQIPQLNTMAKANELIHKWIAKRGNVVLLDNAMFMRQSHANEQITLQRRVIPRGETSKLLQKDNLHPTRAGANAVCYAMLESLQKSINFPDTDVNWNASE